MTLSRDVPNRIGGVLKPFLHALTGGTGISPADIVAVHPGGPKIIEGVQQALALSDEQVRCSQEVLYDRGNMSSVTLPTIWSRLLRDPSIQPGTRVISLAFGPGLTIAGAVFRRCAQ
jgi:predicted naringenin-chalcone synthase